MVAIEHRQTVSSSIASTTTTSVVTITPAAASAAAAASASANINYNNNSLGLTPLIVSPVSTVSSLSTVSSTTASITSTGISNNNNNNHTTMQDLDMPKAIAPTTTTNTTTTASELETPATTAAAGGDTASTVSGTAAKSAVSQRNVDIKISKKTQEVTKKILKLDLSGKELDEYSLKSPKSPISARLSHQTSLTSSVDVEDRKTLREALYQGIFHRHRRTIFAVGSFLRMLRSRNSQYNTIRSSSEGDGEDVDEVK